MIWYTYKEYNYEIQFKHTISAEYNTEFKLNSYYYAVPHHIPQRSLLFSKSNHLNKSLIKIEIGNWFGNKHRNGQIA